MLTFPNSPSKFLTKLLLDSIFTSEYGYVSLCFLAYEKNGRLLMGHRPSSATYIDTSDRTSASQQLDASKIKFSPVILPISFG